MLSLGMLLASCITTSMSVEIPKVAKACTEIFLPIQWSSHDTPKTIIQIKEHNAVWDAEKELGK